jgi:hypothetical protein
MSQNQPPTRSASQIAEMQATIEALTHRLRQLEENNPVIQFENRLRIVESTASTSGSPVPISSGDKVKVSLPDKYDGSMENYQEFVASLDNYLTIKASVYTTDEIKIRFIGTLFKKNALSWFTVLIRKESDLLTDYERFMANFEKMFSDPNAKRTAQTKLKELKQGASKVSDYANEFRRISVDAGYNEDALMAHYREGLNDPIKNVLAQTLEQPENLEELISWTQRIDARLRERKKEVIGQKLDGHVASATYNKKKGSKNMNLTCSYCQKKGHSEQFCWSKNKKSSKMDSKQESTSMAAVAETPSGSQ